MILNIKKYITQFYYKNIKLVDVDYSFYDLPIYKSDMEVD